MKKYFLIATIFSLTLSLLCGCGNTQPENPTVPTTTEPVENLTEADTTLPDTTSPYADSVYAQQIGRYYTAISQQWDANAYLDNDMCALAAHYCEGTPMENIGFVTMDLDSDGQDELIIGAIQNASNDPVVFEIWTLQNGEPTMLAQSGSHNRYYLQYSQDEALWSVAYEAENGGANHAVYYLQLCEGEWMVTQGVIFDGVANENAPWFMTYDLDWDVSNDDPITQDLADAITTAGRNLYTAAAYIPYSQYQ